MKLVTYTIKEDELNIQSTHFVGARMGWLSDDWVIDIGFAQQWLIYFRHASFSWLLPNQLSGWFEQENYVSKLRQIYEAIKGEDPSQLWIQGEPVALSINEVNLLPPLLEPQKIFYPTQWHNIYSSPHPESILGTTFHVRDSQNFSPGIAYLLGHDKKISGCCLLNYWCNPKRALPALGPFLVTDDELNMSKERELKVWCNGQLVAQQKLDLHTLIAQQPDGEWRAGEMMTLVFSPFSFAVQSQDLVKIEMEYLGCLQNRADKV